jgi:SAM-dependent methyltransferase
VPAFDVSEHDAIKQSVQFEKEIKRAVRPYVFPTLLLYDAGVYRIWNPYIWECPTSSLQEHFDRYVRSIHLEAGCGTGYLPDRCRRFDNRSAGDSHKQWMLTLLDYSPGSLAWAGRRLRRYQPHLIRHNLFHPLPHLSHRFESICLNYVLHCLPGSFAQKEKVIANLKAVMAPEGVLFGSIILGTDAAKNNCAGAILKLYNFIGSFHNTHDTAEDLAVALSNNFQYHACRVIGSVALFAASDRKL